jgi:cytochrome c oxidase subunit 2
MRVLRSRKRAGLGRRLVALSVAGVTLAALTGCEVPDFGAPEGATTQGKEIFGLWQGSVVAALAVGAFVLLLILLAMVRFRRRKGDEGVPSQKQYNITLEVIYTLVPLLIVAGLFYFTVQKQTEVTQIAANPTVRVEVTAFQWGWRFSYADSDVVVESQGDGRPTLVLPVGQTTRITLVSVDVVHSFYVPDFLYKRDAIPGIVNTFDFEPVRTGTFLGRCAEFCGLRHADMLFDVSVVGAEEFQQWLATENATNTTADTAAPTSTTTTTAAAPGQEGTVP